MQKYDKFTETYDNIFHNIQANSITRQEADTSPARERARVEHKPRA
jgi:hypothetical protein